jgi:hypothetical protein
MTSLALWVTVLAGSAVCLGLKLAGAYVPRRLLDRPAVMRVMSLVTVALLAGLLAIQAMAAGHGLTIDARLAGLAVAGVALWRKAPFILVVILAAAVAAGLRALGWG